MRGDRFKRRLPKFIGQISDIDDTFYAEDKEFELIDKLIDDFENSQSVSGIAKTSDPDYFLRKLEIDYGLDHKGSTKERIAKILLKMRAKRTTTKEVVLEICQSLGFPAKYEQKYREYAFLLELYVNGDLNMKALTEALMQVTPAHLWIYLNINFARELKLQTQYGDDSCLIYLCGEHPCGDIPYPWAEVEPYYVGFDLNTSAYDAKNYYGYAGTEHLSGELRDWEEAYYNYVQNFSLDTIYDFGGDK
nr:MAG TPA: tail protein [Caudoviricetes sp.]